MSAKEEIDIAIDTEDEPAAAENILSPPVVTKYQTAGDLASRALAFVLPRCVPGVTVFELCALGNENIVALAKTVFNKGSVAKVFLNLSKADIMIKLSKRQPYR